MEKKRKLDRNDSGPMTKKPKPLGVVKKVHRLRFLQNQLFPVRQLAWDAETKRLAVARSQGSVEIWSFHPDPSRALHQVVWYLERRLPGAIGRKVEALAWCRGRLLASGVSGSLLEFDQDFCIRREIPALGGGVTCMAANEGMGKVALASYDGTVIVYDVLDEGIVYDKTLERRREKILSLDWNVKGDTLVTGCKGVALIWDFASGRVRDHLLFPKEPTKHKTKRGKIVEKAALIWAIGILADETVVTGDSSGFTSFWDLKTVTLRTQFKTHQAAILTLCVSHDEKAVWTAGVDPSVAEIRRDRSSSSGWQLGHVNIICRNDVRAMVYVQTSLHHSEGIVFSGDDPRLFLTCVKKEKIRAKLGKSSNNVRFGLAPGGFVSLSSGSPILASFGYGGVDVWRLGEAKEQAELPLPPGTRLPLRVMPDKLVEIADKGSKFYSAVALNDDATLLCLSSEGRSFVFRLNLSPESTTSVEKIASLKGKLSPALLDAQFVKVDGDDVLVTLTRRRRLEFLRFRRKDEGVICRKLTLGLDSPGLATCMSAITRRFADRETTMCVVGFSSGHAVVVEADSASVTSSLPALDGIAATAAALSPDGREAVVAYANCELAIFDIDSRITRYFKWEGSNFHPSSVNGLTFVSDDKILVHTDRRVFTLIRKGLINDSMTVRRQEISGFEFVNFIGATKDGAVVVAETTTEKFEDSLPRPLFKKKFGT